MAKQGDLEIPKALRLVEEGLKLDNENRDQEAYAQYLKSISFISNSLLQNSEPGVNSQQIKRLVNVARQCLDRVEALSDNSNKAPVKSTTMPNISSSIDTACLMMSDISEINGLQTRQNVSPLEKAQKENQHLIGIYQTRFARTTNPVARANLNLELQRKLSENLQLAKSKQAIRTQQLEIKRKELMQQAFKKVGQTGNTVSREDEERRQMYVTILEFEEHQDWPVHIRQKLEFDNFSEPAIKLAVQKTLSVQSHPICKLMNVFQRHLFDKSHTLLDRLKKNKFETQYKQREDRINLNLLHPQHSPSSINSNESGFFEENLVNRILVEDNEGVSDVADDDPMAKFEQKYIDDMKSLRIADEEARSKIAAYECCATSEKNMVKSSMRTVERVECENIVTMELEAVRKHLDDILMDIRKSISNITELFILTFENQQGSSNNKRRDVWNLSVLECFISPLWNVLINLMRLANQEEEESLKRAIQKLGNKPPDEFGVPSEFCLMDDKFQSAISELSKIVETASPQKKMAKLVNVARILCNDTSKNKKLSEMKSVGADDLIPMLTYIIIRSKVSQIGFECYALEELVPESFLMGEEGYCITSVETAVHYLQTLVPLQFKNISNSHRRQHST